MGKWSFSLPGDVVGMIGLQSALKFNGGGHINHSIFWEVLSPDGGGVPQQSKTWKVKRIYLLR